MNKTSKDIYAGFTVYSTIYTIEYAKPQYIRKIIKELDDKLWHEDLQEKNSLILYREYTYFTQSKNRNFET